jgi:hypothetical protein
VHLDIIKVFYSPPDAQVNCLKNNIKIYIKTALTRFGAVTIIRERIIRALITLIISSKMFVIICQTIRRYSPEDNNFNIRGREKLKCLSSIAFF